LTDNASVQEGPKPGSRDVKNIATGIRSLAIQNIGNMVLGFILLGLLVRELPAAQFGIYSAVIAIYTVSLAFSLLGTQFAATRFVALLSKTDPDKAWAAARKILYLALLFGAVSAAIVISISPFLSIYFAKTTAYSLAFVLGALYIFGSTICTIFQSFIQGLRKYELLAKILLVSRVAGLVLTAAALLEFKNVLVPLAAWILFTAIITLWVLKTIWKDLVGTRGDFDYRTILRYAVPLGIGSIVFSIANYADQIFVGGFLSAVALAVYSAAVLVSTAIGSVLFLPINTTFLPEAARIESTRELANGLRLAIRFGVLTILPASMIQAGLSAQVLALFSGSSTYIAGTESLQALSLLFVFVPLQGITTSLLQATGETLKAMFVGLSMVAAVVLLSIALIPPFGILGASLANALISVVGFVVGAYYTKRYLFLSATFIFYLKVLLGSFAALAVTLALTIFVSNRTLSLIPYSIVGLVVFLASVKALGVITEEDRNYFSHVMPASLRWLLIYL
jgi:stage V sporulation protein B